MDTSDDHTGEITEPVSSHDGPLIDDGFGRSAPQPLASQETLLAWVHAVVRWSTPAHTHLRRIPKPPDRVGVPDAPESTIVWHVLR